MNKQNKPLEISPFGKIPGNIWHNEQWFIAKIQIPIAGNAMDEALIYDETQEWNLFVPLSWVKDIDFHGGFKVYRWAWFDKKEHGLHIEGEVTEEEAGWW